MKSIITSVVVAAIVGGCALFDYATLQTGCAAFKIAELSLVVANGISYKGDWACGNNWGDVYSQMLHKHPTMIAVVDAKVCDKEKCDAVAEALLAD